VTVAAGKHWMPRVQIWLGEVADPEFPMYADPKRPQLLLGSARDDPLQRMVKLANGSAVGSGARFAQCHGIKPRMDLLESLPQEIRGSDSYRTREEASATRSRIRDHLLGCGYVLDAGNGDRIFTVYVINLLKAVGDDRGSTKWVYVGETSKAPEERLEQHLAGGIKSNAAVSTYGVDLNEHLMSEIPQVRFRQDALWLEHHVGEELKQRGYKVEGAH